MKNFYQPYLDIIKNALKKPKKEEESKIFSDVIVINSDGKFLVLKRSNMSTIGADKWCLPGGHVENGEHPSMGGLRELKEETNIEIDIENLDFFKSIKLDNGTELNYYIATTYDLESNVVIDANEHQGYEWIFPDDINKKDFIFDLKDFLLNSFNLDIENTEKSTDLLSFDDRVSDIMETLNKSFDNNEINVDVYLDKINKINTIKGNYQKNIEIRKGSDGSEYSVKLNKSENKPQKDIEDIENSYENYVSSGFLYNDRLYDENGLGIVVEPSKIKNIVQKFPNIYQVDCSKLDSITTGHKTFEDTRRNDFEKVLPTIKKYNEYYNKYDSELRESFSSTQNDFKQKISEIKKSLDNLYNDLETTNGNGGSVMSVIDYITSQIKSSIDPLLIISIKPDENTIYHRQIFLTELKNYVESNPNLITNIKKIKIDGLDNYGEGEFEVVYYNPDDIDNISTVHDKSVKRFRRNFEYENSVKKSLDDGEINEDEFLELMLKGEGDITHGGKLSKKQSVDKNGKKTTKWVKNDSELPSVKEQEKINEDEIRNHAKNSSLSDLEDTIKNSSDEKLRKIAHEEIKRREDEEHIKEDDKDSKVSKSDDEIDINKGKPEIKKGCLMYYPSIDLDKWNSNLKKLIPENIVEEYETDPHLTILYGFDDDLLIKEYLENFVKDFFSKNIINFNLDPISLFENDKDVVKIGVKDLNGNLTKLNSLLKEHFYYQNDYPDYKPHITLAYVNKGYGKQFDGTKINVYDWGLGDKTEGTILYSDSNKNKTVITTTGNPISKGENDYFEKAKALPVGHINKYNQEKQADGTWKHVSKKKVENKETTKNESKSDFFEINNDVERDEYFRKLTSVDELQHIIENGGIHYYEEYLKSLKGDIEFEKLNGDYNDFMHGVTTAFKTHKFESDFFKPEKKEFSDFSKCSRTEMAFIFIYTSMAYKLINRYNSGSYEKEEITIPDDIKNTINMFNQLINKGLGNIENVIDASSVYRVFNTQRDSEFINEKMINYQMNVGNEFKYDTLLSTTYDKKTMTTLEMGHSNKMIGYQIENKNGKCIKDISAFEGEDEVLFPTTSKFSVDKVQFDGKVGEFGGEHYSTIKHVVFLKEI